MRTRLHETVFDRISMLGAHIRSNWRKRNGLLSSEKTSISVTTEAGGRQRDTNSTTATLSKFSYFRKKYVYISIQCMLPNFFNSL